MVKVTITAVKEAQPIALVILAQSWTDSQLLGTSVKYYLNLRLFGRKSRRIIIGVERLLGAWRKHGRQTLCRVGAESCASFPAGFSLPADQSDETPSDTPNSQNPECLASQPIPKSAFPNYISKGLTIREGLSGMRYLRIKRSPFLTNPPKCSVLNRR